MIQVTKHRARQAGLVALAAGALLLGALVEEPPSAMVAERTGAVEHAASAPMPELLPPVSSHGDAVAQCGEWFEGEQRAACVTAADAVPAESWPASAPTVQPTPGAVKGLDGPAPVPDPEVETCDTAQGFEVTEHGCERATVELRPNFQEDDPLFDCRLDGNRACGVQVHGVWYVIQFSDTAEPVAVWLRDQ